MSQVTTRRDASGELPTKAAYEPMSEERKIEVVTELTDDVLAALTVALFQVIKREKWGKRDLAKISGMNETSIGHIFAGRRKNLTVESIALLARAMRKRPELVLHDVRGTANDPALSSVHDWPNSAADALQERQTGQTTAREQGARLPRAVGPEHPGSIFEYQADE